MADIKKAFYDVTRFLSANSTSTAQRLMGSACENWLRTEICSILNFEDGSGISKNANEFVYDEDNKRDISIYKDANDGSTKLLHHIELKVVYPSYSLTQNAQWLTSLKCQLERPFNINEPTDTRRHGWVFSIWTSNYSHIEPSNYFSEVKNCLQVAFPNDKYTAQHEFRAESIFNVELPWRGSSTCIILKGIYFSKRNI